MAFLDDLSKIKSDFSKSLDQIFQKTSNSSTKNMSDLFNERYGGVGKLSAANWRGNNDGQSTTKVLRYGFSIFTSSEIEAAKSVDNSSPSTYFLDIPPQSISQKENFSTNIQATRKGIIVESEGVIFKDIIIQGTTGIMPGPRGSYNTGVRADNGLSSDPVSKNLSGYQEFLQLRQFFLKYAYDKVHQDGDRFLVFINEKDNQTLIVEPLEFTMERNSKSPLMYNYRIVLKSIGTLSGAIKQLTLGKNPTDNLDKGLTEDIITNIKNGRKAINALSSGLLKAFQLLDHTVNGPLRQLQLAAQDITEGVTTTLSLPSVLYRNTTSTILGIAEGLRTTGAALFGDALKGKYPISSAAQNANFISGTENFSTPIQGQKILSTSDSRLIAATNQKQIDSVKDRMEADSRVNLPRTFVEDTKKAMNNVANNFADSINMGDPLYDSIKGRIVTETPSPLKIASDDEFLLLGNILSTNSSLNNILANNSIFQAIIETNFEETQTAFQDPSLPQSQQLVQVKKPRAIREIVIKQGDTLERIAARELGDASKWLDIVILNSLKPPFLNSVSSDGVKGYGDKLMIPVG